MKELAEFERKVGEINDLAELLIFVRDETAKLGAVRQSYHLTPVFGAPTSAQTEVYANGFSREWLALYSEKNFRVLDPIPSFTLRHGKPIHWMEAIEQSMDQPGVAEFAAALAEHGLSHGFGVPLYGPHGRDAYCSFDLGRPTTSEDEPIVMRMRGMAQVAHQKICQLVEQGQEMPTLSQRESEVLGWMAEGKSNTDIGTIPDISPETVRTYTQRIFQKLGASDRTSATVKALKLGVLTLPSA